MRWRRPWAGRGWITAAAIALAGVGLGLGSQVQTASGQEQESEPVDLDPLVAEPVHLASPASSSSAPSSSTGTDEVIGVAGTSLETAVVVTRSGRVFALAAREAAWDRVNTGGLSARLSQVQGFAGEVWGVGDEAPAFRFARPTWSASPVNRKGAARLASCALPALVAGRRVFVRDRQKWKELHRLPGKESIATLCVVELGRAAVLLASGDVQVLEGGAWKTLVLARRGVATSASRVVWLGGALRPVVATETGKLYRLDGSKPVALGLDARLSGFRPSVAASANKREWIVGVGSNASSGVETSVIVRLDGKKLVLVDELPLAVEGEWIGMVATDAGVQLLATHDGTVVRRGESGAWVVEKLPNAASASPSVPRPDNPPARVGATPH